MYERRRKRNLGPIWGKIFFFFVFLYSMSLNPAIMPKKSVILILSFVLCWYMAWLLPFKKTLTVRLSGTCLEVFVFNQIWLCDLCTVYRVWKRRLHARSWGYVPMQHSDHARDAFYSAIPNQNLHLSRQPPNVSSQSCHQQNAHNSNRRIAFVTELRGSTGKLANMFSISPDFHWAHQASYLCHCFT